MLVSQFRSVAKRQASSAAIVEKSAIYTYSELDSSTDMIAQALIREGVERGAHVGLLIGRSADFVKAVLGILKAKGVYVPIDSVLPRKRIHYIVEDSGIEYLLVVRTLIGTKIVNSLVELGVKILVLEDLLDNSSCIEEGSLSDLSADSGDVTSCLIYTSGTTGEPKGILIPHRGIIQLVVGQGSIPIVPKDCFGHGTNCSFDASILEIWGALLNGAKLAVLDNETISSAALLTDSIAKHSINRLFLTPALFYEYVLEGVDFSALDSLILGGEVLNPKIVAQAFNEGLVRPGCLINGYGPAEATACTTTFQAKALSFSGESVPIGKPIDGAEVYVLDEQMNPVAQGDAGELYIGGSGVANGYWNRPDLTKERFLPNVFSPNKQGMLYRTGDFVRCLPCGNLDFIGRKDNQVKIRGFRIELDGIENRLNQLPGVQSSCVHLHVCDRGNKQIVAHIVPCEAPFYSLQELREKLRSVIPEYMIPNKFFLLESMPITQNGKINRNVLKAFPGKPLRGSNAYVAPETKQELILHKIWQFIFNREDIGISDNFFELGGDSINAIEMIDEAKKMDMDLDISCLFFAPTIRQLALSLMKN